MQKIEDTLPLYMSAGTVAKVLDCSKATVWRYADSGILPKPIRFSERVIRWHRDDILSLNN